MNKYDYHKMLKAILHKDAAISFLPIARKKNGLVPKLATKFEVSRPTIYLWLEKFDRDRKLIEEGDKLKRDRLVPAKLIQSAKDAYSSNSINYDGESTIGWARAKGDIQQIDDSRIDALMTAISCVSSGRYNSEKRIKKYLAGVKDKIFVYLDAIGNLEKENR